MKEPRSGFWKSAPAPERSPHTSSDACGPADTLDLVELNESFVDRLRERFASEPPFREVSTQTRVLCSRVETLDGDQSYDLIVSGLPLNNFSVADVQTILSAFGRLLKPGGVISFFEYVAIRTARGIVSRPKERAAAARHRQRTWPALGRTGNSPRADLAQPAASLGASRPAEVRLAVLDTHGMGIPKNNAATNASSTTYALTVRPPTGSTKEHPHRRLTKQRTHGSAERASHHEHRRSRIARRWCPGSDATRPQPHRTSPAPQAKNAVLRSIRAMVN